MHDHAWQAWSLLRRSSTRVLDQIEFVIKLQLPIKQSVIESHEKLEIVWLNHVFDYMVFIHVKKHKISWKKHWYVLHVMALKWFNQNSSINGIVFETSAFGSKY